jgi:hypothetical protein
MILRERIAKAIYQTYGDDWKEAGYRGDKALNQADSVIEELGLAGEEDEWETDE